jgi:hypothetical protein
MKKNSDRWVLRTSGTAQIQEFRSLLNGDVPALVFPSFVESLRCAEIITNLVECGMGSLGHISHHVGRLGLTQMEHYLKGRKSEYFNAVNEASLGYGRIVGIVGVDPLKAVMSLLATLSGVPCSIANEPGFGPYFAGSFRNVTTLGHLHFDYAPLETRGWAISEVSRQLTWNLYLNAPSGGALVVYDKQYSPADESTRKNGDYWYLSETVSGARRVTYQPAVGDLVIFNSRNFHEVLPVSGDRYSLSSFAGQMPGGDWALWS